MNNKTGKEIFVKGLTLFEAERMRKEKKLSKQLKLLKDNNDKPDWPYRTKKFPYKKKKIKKI